ncbi:MAG: signal peptidase I [bacterium]|nr:signal peptidase I [bacterium]
MDYGFEFGAHTFILPLILLAVVFIGMWKAFEKAGKPGWACIIPIYNIIVMLEIADKPVWWILLLFIPGVNLIASILISISIAEKFGQGTGFALGLVFLGFIFWAILGFGDAKYQG